MASWFQPPGRKIEDLKAELGLLRSQLEKITICIKATPPQSIFWGISTSETLSGQKDSTNHKSGSPFSSLEGGILIGIMNVYGLEQLVHFPTRKSNTPYFSDCHFPS